MIRILFFNKLHIYRHAIFIYYMWKKNLYSFKKFKRMPIISHWSMYKITTDYFDSLRHLCFNCERKKLWFIKTCFIDILLPDWYFWVCFMNLKVNLPTKTFLRFLPGLWGSLSILSNKNVSLIKKNFLFFFFTYLKTYNTTNILKVYPWQPKTCYNINQWLF